MNHKGSSKGCEYSQSQFVISFFSLFVLKYMCGYNVEIKQKCCNTNMAMTVYNGHCIDLNAVMRSVNESNMCVWEEFVGEGK